MKWSRFVDFFIGFRCSDGSREHCYHRIYLEVTDPRCRNVEGKTHKELWNQCCRCGIEFRHRFANE